MEEFINGMEEMYNSMYFILSYSKIFAIVVGIAFLVVFGGLVIINANIHEIKKQNEYIINAIEVRNNKGGNGNG